MFTPKPRSMWYNKHVNISTNGSDGNFVPGDEQEYFFTDDPDKCNLIGSLGTDGKHYPVIDFDVPIVAVPSATEGHYHLYIEKPLTWKQYKSLLDGLFEADLIQNQWWSTALAKACSYVRPPWLKKGQKPAKEFTPINIEMDDERFLKKLKAQGAQKWQYIIAAYNTSQFLYKYKDRTWTGMVDGQLETNLWLMDSWFGMSVTQDCAEYAGFKYDKNKGYWMPPSPSKRKKIKGWNA